MIADAAPADEALVRSLGSDHVVPRGASFASAVRELVPDGVDALADAAVQRDEVVDAVRDGRVFFDLRGCRSNEVRGIEFVQVMVFSEYRSFDKLEQLRHTVESATLTPRIGGAAADCAGGGSARAVGGRGPPGRCVLTC
ncbi:hypothetical protein [Curtobacterium sp. MCPF17_047]|uniref:hypothetical protein n=1 Tax=Curtobacterium sp. MCPF17_047 TaxID=2175654 RepID=UPI0011B594E5|nr:hypothetical protein [Curtobacterium sp. MCPF17_047]